MEKAHKQILFKVKKEIYNLGNSKAIILPAQVLDLLEIEGGTAVTLTVEEGKHGKYIAIFKQPQEQE